MARTSRPRPRGIWLALRRTLRSSGATSSIVLIVVTLALGSQLPRMWRDPGAIVIDQAGAMRKLCNKLALAAAQPDGVDWKRMASEAVEEKDKRLSSLLALSVDMGANAAAAVAKYQSRWLREKESIGPGGATLAPGRIPELLILHDEAERLVRALEEDADAKERAEAIAVAGAFGVAFAAISWQLGIALHRRRRERLALERMQSSLAKAGMQVERIPGAHPDVNVSKLADAVAATLQRELAVTEVTKARLQEVIDNVSDGIISIDDSQRIVLFNRAAGTMFGVEPSTALQKNLSELIPEAVRHRHTHWVQDFRTTGTTRRMAGSRRLSATHSDGHQFDIEVTLSASGLPDERLMTAVVRNVTAEHQLEDERAQRIASDAAGQERSRLMGFVAHELGNALNPIAGAVHLIKNAERPEQRQRLLSVVEMATQAAARLMTDLLDLARAESRALSVDCKPVDAIAVANEAVAELEFIASEAGVTLTKHLGESAALVLADQDRLRQCLVNLLSNAVKYNRRGGMACLALERHGAAVHFRVTDTGVGMTDADLSRLFIPFERLSQTRGDRPGAGLGLVISQRLIEQMGGNLKVASEVGRGTTFEFTLPSAIAT